MVTAATHDPIVVADVVLDAALAADADAVVIEPATHPGHYTIAVARRGETLAVSAIDTQLAIHTIARIGYVCQVDPAAPRATTGRARVRSCDAQRDLVITIAPGAQPRAELAFLACGAKQPRREPRPGERIGHYAIVCALGAGGMGDVYEVEHVALKRRAALKILQHTVIARDADSLERFRIEAQATARIRSPHVVEVYDFGYLEDGRPYFVMELLEGKCLADLVACEALAPADVVTIARQLASALCAVHDRGVVHGDVTPSNALVIGDDPLQVKLIDFGLAAIAGEAFHEDNTEFVLGTPSYISPEQLRGLPATDRSDQYGLGIVVFELLAGHAPYRNDDLRELCMMHIEAPIPIVASPHGPLPPKLAEVIATCMQKSPQQRFPGMRALLAALDEIDRVARQRGWRKWLP